MSLSPHFLSPNTLPHLRKFQPPVRTTTSRPNKTRQTHCTSNNKNNASISDADLALDLATEVAKLKTQFVQREEAMDKSRELLFSELCRFMGSEKAEVKRKWTKFDEEEKWVLVKEFVNEWGTNFHPLSARSVKELIDEYLHQPNKPSSSTLFPGL